MTERFVKCTEFQKEIGEHLVYLRDNWIRTTGCREYSRCDGRSQWYVGIAADLYGLNDNNAVPDSCKNDVEKFLEVYPKLFTFNSNNYMVNFGSNINFATDTIDIVLKELGIKTNLSSKNVFINKLLSLRYDWIDSIPDRFVHSTDGWYKIRTCWMLGVAAYFDIGIEDKLFSSEFEPKAKELINWWVNVYGKEPERKRTNDVERMVINTAEDINRLNTFLDEAIKDLGFIIPNYS